MTQTPKPDLPEHEEEAAPFDDVLRKLLSAKPARDTAPGKQLPPKPAKTQEP